MTGESDKPRNPTITDVHVGHHGFGEDDHDDTTVVNRELIAHLLDDKPLEKDTVEFSMQPNLEFPLGMQLGNLRLTSLIGEGGMGKVYRAEHVTLGTPYAVKVLHASLDDKEVVEERFRREAMTCSQLRHPNVVFVTDYGVSESLGLYLVMEFLEGESLDAIIKRGPVPLWRCFSIVTQLCNGLAAAHRTGVVHRDLKPENIFILPMDGDDQVKIVDFGIARISASQNLTAAGSAIGTPDYMAPEQIMGQSAKFGPPTDIYAVGGIFYEMVTGRPPFEGTTPIEVLHKHMKGDRPQLSNVRADLGGTELEKLVQSMLAVENTDRPEDCAVLYQRFVTAFDALATLPLDDLDPPVPSQAQFPFRNAQQRARAGAPYLELLDPAVLPEGSALLSFSHWSRLLMTAGNEPLPPHVFLLAAWGFAARDLVDAPVESKRFVAASRLVNRIGVDVCDAGQAEGIELVARSLSDLGSAVTSESRAGLQRALKPLLDHPRMVERLGKSGASGKSLKAILTTDVRNLFK